jgi:hypothetical protein
MKKLVVRHITWVVALLLMSCSPAEPGKYKAYLYKQPERDGLICVFYSNHPGNAERNAQMFATLHEEKYGVPLIIRTQPY